MISLKNALKLNKDDLIQLKKEISKKIQSSNLNAYKEQYTQKEIIPSIDGGVPIGIKDIISVQNHELSGASNILKGYISPYNATVIDNMHKNNLCAYGRMNMDEFAMGSLGSNSIYGKTLNPYDNRKSSGGSSSGSASSVGGGIAIASLGTDTGGSIRQPASYCGCVGFKPSYGRVSRYGIAAYASSFDQCGTFSQDVYDSALLYDIISGYDEKDSTSANISYDSIVKNLDKNKKYTIAVVPNFVDNAHKDIKDAYNSCIDKLKEAGHNISEIKIGENMLKAQLSAYYIIACGEAATNLARYDGIRYGARKTGDNLEEIYINSRTKGFSTEVKKRIMLGNFVLSSGYYDAYYIKAQKVRALVKKQFDDIFNNADLILSPITPSTAPSFDAYKSSLDMYLSDTYTIGVNLASLPAISIPYSKNKNNMPIGLQLIGKKFDELNLFNASLSLEEIANFKSDFF